MLELEDALKRILAQVRPLDLETVAVAEAAGRVAGMTAAAAVDLPPFDNSAMDGYAVRAVDLPGAGAGPAGGTVLRLVGKVAAGEVFSGAVEPGACVRVFTGSALPRGADAVVMQEDTQVDPDRPDQIRILDTVKPWENVRFRGEDVKRGATVVTPGMRLTAGRIALLAAAGLGEIRLARRPRVTVLATGSELVEAGGASPPPGRIFESNRAMLAALVRRAGAVPEILPLTADTTEATRAALERGLAAGDALVTSGGVSVGDYDLVRAAFEGLGGKVDFWRVSIRPGRPFLFGQRGGRFLFGLPGNPVSALVTFLLLVRPALQAMQGESEPRLPGSPGILSEPLVNRGDRRHFMRVTVDAAGRVRSAGAQSSHHLSSLAGADGLVEVPPGTGLAEGTAVTVLRFD